MTASGKNSFLDKRLRCVSLSCVFLFPMWHFFVITNYVQQFYFCSFFNSRRAPIAVLLGVVLTSQIVSMSGCKLSYSLLLFSFHKILIFCACHNEFFLCKLFCCVFRRERKAKSKVSSFTAETLAVSTQRRIHHQPVKISLFIRNQANPINAMLHCGGN